MLALLIGGALGAAAGSWLGTFGYAALPDTAALSQRVLPQTGGDPVSELVHAHGFTFGPTIELMRALGLTEGSLLTPGDLGQLWIWGFALIAVAAILARPGNDPATTLTSERADAGEPG